MHWFEKIHQHAVRCSRQYKRSEYELIMALQTVHAKRVYRKMGYASLFDYAVKALKLPEGNAYAFINVSRKAVQMPMMTKALETGEITVSQAKRVISVMTPETQALWLEKTKTLTQRQLEQEVAKENPKFSIPERIKPVCTDRLRLECGIDEVLENKLERVKAILSQKRSKICSLEETLDAMTDEFLERHDPFERAKRLPTRKPDGTLPPTGKTIAPHPSNFKGRNKRTGESQAALQRTSPRVSRSNYP